MSNIILGIGDFNVSGDQNKSIKTFALGSCVAFIAWDLVSKTGGMAHIALPHSDTDPTKALSKPGYFANTAIPLVLRMMKKRNPGINRKSLIIKLAGGASIMDKNNFFNIGKRNIEISRTIIQELGFTIFKEDTGSTISRTVTLDITSGIVLLFNPVKGIWEL